MSEAFELFFHSLCSYSLENNEQIIHGKYAFLFGQTCAPHSDAYEVIHLYNMDSPGDPPVEMTHKLPIGETVRTTFQIIPSLTAFFFTSRDQAIN